MNNRISNKFTLPGLIRFSLPAIAMLVLSSLYTMVDGVFVSRFVGSDALSSINIVVPLDYFIYGLGVMFGSGGSAKGNAGGSEKIRFFQLYRSLSGRNSCRR